MPGMLETILDIGLCDATVPALLRATGDPLRVGLVPRLIRSYAEVVDGCPPAPSRPRSIAAGRYGAPDASSSTSGPCGARSDASRGHRSIARRPFPQDPQGQLFGAVEAVLRSWNHEARSIAVSKGCPTWSAPP